MLTNARGITSSRCVSLPHRCFLIKTFFLVSALYIFVSCRHVPLESASPISFSTETKQTFEVSGRSKTFTGWHICLDPGHGGSATGAIAPVNGLRESDVNLRIALEVRRILEEHGVRVTLTRDTDKSLADNPSDDLSRRPALAEQTEADLFVSLHHNADIVAHSQKNGLEVYYKLQDSGASLDLAQCLVAPLVKQLSHVYNTSPQVLPGNYKVLRLSRLPAVLLESSYMTCDANAKFLSSPRGINQEAEGIAEGLLQYIRMSPPRFLSGKVQLDEVGPGWWVSLDFQSDFDLDFSTFSLNMNGKTMAIPVRVNGRSVWFGDNVPLPNGLNICFVSVRNNQGATGSAAIKIPVDRPPSRIYVRQQPEDVFSGVDVEVEVTVLDRFGLPVKDGTNVHILPPGCQLSTIDGKARFYVPCGEVTRRLRVEAGDCRADFAIQHGSKKWRQVICTDKITHKTVSTALIVGNNFFGRVSPEGVGYVPEWISEITVTAPGYAPSYVQLDTLNSVALVPVDGGILLGKRIVIDPAHGGRISGGIDMSGVRAADVSLDVALRLAALLRAAGAQAELTRSDDLEVSDLQRLRKAEELRPDVLLVLSYGMTAEEARVLDEGGYLRSDVSAFVGHYPNSASGALLAECIAKEFPSVEKVSSVAYLVQQTSCSSVIVQPVEFTSDGSIASSCGMVEERQRHASRIYAALLEYFRSRER